MANIIDKVKINDKQILLCYTNGKSAGINSQWPGVASLRINDVDVDAKSLIGRKVLDNRKQNYYYLVNRGGQLKNVDYLSDVFLLDNGEIMIAKLTY